MTDFQKELLSDLKNLGSKHLSKQWKYAIATPHVHTKGMQSNEILGQTQNKEKRIVLNPELINMVHDKDFWHDTITHEVGHAILRDQLDQEEKEGKMDFCEIIEQALSGGHSKRWAKIANSLGCRGASAGITQAQRKVLNNTPAFVKINCNV